ncbi:FIG00711868: hypothetical protein [Helicobacter ailurogastricus]|uniref:Naphthoate synthase n=1 Tax=Helicobacter ailurogastricus TaxID=1578720 RepID=A0A0K2X4C0_9HELI|nr:Naphthoate synthase [Helicobacter ailurogastricus]CRF41897.1 Naphthoate synthase [Helicobacter ailurogastricus]CRF43740.1 Naphthoate synthase [Helicobacter ailurogastricus]CRI32286.1 FIG00711868: hypothetical protein [Helicobacter ailurogastricus]
MKSFPLSMAYPHKRVLCGLNLFLKPNGPILASFSKLKCLNSSNFKTFRTHFNARFLGGFMCPGEHF